MSLVKVLNVSARASPMKRTIRRSVIVLAFLAGLVWTWHEMNVWPLRRALPWSASEVHEWSWEDGFLPDYTYVLKARITPDEFRTYVETLGLTPHTAERTYEDDDGWLNWRSHGCHEEWWKPSESLQGTFVINHGDMWTYAKYEDGYIYVKSLNH